MFFGFCEAPAASGTVLHFIALNGDTELFREERRSGYRRFFFFLGGRGSSLTCLFSLGFVFVLFFFCKSA